MEVSVTTVVDVAISVGVVESSVVDATVVERSVEERVDSSVTAVVKDRVLVAAVE